jgi:hypothetical protein
MDISGILKGFQHSNIFQHIPTNTIILGPKIPVQIQPVKPFCLWRMSRAEIPPKISPDARRARRAGPRKMTPIRSDVSWPTTRISDSMPRVRRCIEYAFVASPPWRWRTIHKINHIYIYIYCIYIYILYIYIHICLQIYIYIRVCVCLCVYITIWL